jgi:thioredoxin 1
MKMRHLAAVVLGLAMLSGCEPSFNRPGGYGIEPVEVTDANFQQVVLDSKQPVLVDVTATWCGPCQLLKPKIHELAADYKDRAVIGQLDGPGNPSVLREYEVEGYPTLLLFKDGKLVDKQVGYSDNKKEELSAKLDEMLAAAPAAAAE